MLACVVTQVWDAGLSCPLGTWRRKKGKAVLFVPTGCFFSLLLVTELPKVPCSTHITIHLLPLATSLENDTHFGKYSWRQLLWSGETSSINLVPPTIHVYWDLLCPRKCAEYWDKVTRKANRDPMLLDSIQNEKHLSVRLLQRIAVCCRNIF